jgi:hypothetical protein
LLLCVAVVLVGFAAFMVAATLYPREQVHAINFESAKLTHQVREKFKDKVETCGNRRATTMEWKAFAINLLTFPGLTTRK